MEMVSDVYKRQVQSKEELLAWLERTQKLHAQLCDGRETPLPPLQYAVEYKLDGLTINLTYRGGQLVEAATRGNGEVGEAILPQARTIRCVPLSIPYQGLLEVQGECIMRLSTLEAVSYTHLLATSLRLRSGAPWFYEIVYHKRDGKPRPARRVDLL